MKVSRKDSVKKMKLNLYNGKVVVDGISFL